MIVRLLKDVKGQPDGEEDHPSMCEDYTGHQGDGEFEDIERGSLQGFSEATEFVETKNASMAGSGSPHDQCKLMLNDNPMQNQPYQTSAQQHEAMQLNPVRTSLTRVLPLNSQRIVPDGFAM